MSELKFLGFKQVKKSTWDSMPDTGKTGYLWFVRDIISGDTFYDSYLYFGSRLYAQYKHEDEAISEITDILTEAGIIDESGETVDIKSLIEDAQLTEGTAIDIVNGVISVSVADGTTNTVDNIATGKNFLKVNSDDKLEVKGVDTDSTITSDDIKIEGGPLASLAKQAYTDGVLPEGTSIQSFLMSMLCVEKWSATVSTGKTFTASCSAPSFSLTNASSTVEIGTLVTVSNIVSGASSASQSVTAKTMTYGYKIGEDGTLTTSTGYTVNLTPTVSDDTKTVKANYGNLKQKNEDGTFSSVSEETSTTGSIASKQLYVSDGKNTVTVYQSGATYESNTSYNGATLYIATNLGNYYKNDKVTDNTVTVTNPWTTATSITATTSTSKYVTGARAYFFGWMETGNAKSTLTSDDIRGLQTTGLSITKKEYTLSNTSSASQFIIAFPSSLGYTVSTVKDGGALDADITGNFTKNTIDVYSANNFDKVSYDVWEYTPSGNAWDPRTLKITIA